MARLKCSKCGIEKHIDRDDVANNPNWLCDICIMNDDHCHCLVCESTRDLAEAKRHIARYGSLEGFYCKNPDCRSEYILVPYVSIKDARTGKTIGGLIGEDTFFPVAGAASPGQSAEANTDQDTVTLSCAACGEVDTQIPASMADNTPDWICPDCVREVEDGPVLHSVNIYSVKLFMDLESGARACVWIGDNRTITRGDLVSFQRCDPESGLRFGKPLMKRVRKCFTRQESGFSEQGSIIEMADLLPTLPPAAPVDLEDEEGSLAWYAFHESEHGEYHDYCPTWDYDVLGAGEDTEMEELLLRTAPELQEAMIRNGLPGFEVFLTKKGSLGDNVGIYVYGTQQLPVIGLCPENIRDMVEEETKRTRAVYSTLVHELAHAIQESKGLELDEKEAEDLVQSKNTTGGLDEGLLMKQ